MAVAKAGKVDYNPPSTSGAASKAVQLDNHLTEYAVLLFGGGHQWDISQLVTSLAWTETFTTPAVEMTVTLAAPRIRNTILSTDVSKMTGERSPFQTDVRRGPGLDLNTLIKLGMGIRVFAARPQPSGQFTPLQRLASGSYALAGEVFRGFIFTKARTGSASSDSMEITVFDQMVYLGKNDYDTIFKNQTATQIIRSLCIRSGLKLAPVGKDFADTRARIKRLVSYGNNLYDCCSLAIQKNKHITGRYYRLRAEAGTVVLRQRITPKEVWYLTDTTNLIESQFSETIEELVTGVQPKTTGATGRSAYHAQVVNLKLEKLYGRMRKVQDLSNLKSSEVAAGVKTFMKENAKPKVEASVTIPCINTIRAGDLVKLRETDTAIIGLWYVSSVAHSVTPTAATTALQLVKTAQEAEVQQVSETDPATGGKSTNRHVTYDKIRGHDGKTIRFRLSAGIFVPSGKFQGTELLGDEALIKLDRSAAKLLGGAGALVSVQYVHFSIRCIVEVRGDYKPYDVMVSKSAADHIQIQAGNKVFVYPLRKHTSGSSTSGGAHSTRFDHQIIAAGNKYGVSPSLIKGVMEQESAFNPGSVSGAGAVGLMQLMPGTAASMGWSSREGPLTNPGISIKYGTKYLRDQLGAFHSIRLALAAYNGGPGVARRPESSWPSETRNYVVIVTRNYEKYKQAGFG